MSCRGVIQFVSLASVILFCASHLTNIEIHLLFTVNTSRLNLEDNSHKLMMNLSKILQQVKPKNGYKAYMIGIWDGIPNGVAQKSVSMIYSRLTFPATVCYTNISKLNVKDNSHKLAMSISTILQQVKPKNGYKAYMIGIWDGIPNGVAQKSVSMIYSRLTFPATVCYTNISKLNVKDNSHKLAMSISTILQQTKPENGYKAYMTGIWNGIPNCVTQKNMNMVYSGLTFPAVVCYQNISKLNLKDNSQKLMMNISTILQQAEPENGYKAYITGIWSDIPDYVTQKNVNIVYSGLTLTGMVVSYVYPDLWIVPRICVLGTAAIRLVLEVKKLYKADSE